MLRYGLELIQLGPGTAIPASYWGEPEAGLAGRCLFVRPDTPVHSLLHEACHYICMNSKRRAALWREAGGDENEESAVCYLQVLLADFWDLGPLGKPGGAQGHPFSILIPKK